MGKLGRVIKGIGIDAIVDLRPDSPTYGLSETFYLSEDNFIQVWVPGGFGHAFLSLEENTHFVYKCSSLHNGNNESSIHPFDPSLNINWPIKETNAVLSDKDKNAQSFETYKLNPKF